MCKEFVRLTGRALFVLLLAVMPAEANAFRLIWTQEATIADIRAAFQAKELTCRQLVQMYLRCQIRAVWAHRPTALRAGDREGQL